MEDITVIPQWTVAVGSHQLVVNADTLVMSWVVMALLLLTGWLGARRLRVDPGPLQSLWEMVVQGFFDLVVETLGSRGPRYFAFILTLFLFILFSDWIGIVPFLSEPTRDLNTALILGVAGFVVAHVSAIRIRGWRAYLKQYFEPFFVLFPLNVIGELAKVISISFRLYGNIMGGSIIIMVVSSLVRQLVLPPLLYAFFGVFVGTIQAFVFAMLTLTYISVAVQE